MQCKILRSFTFSRDGFTSENAMAGGTADIPGNLVAGLEAEGYLVKDAGPSPEDKMLRSSPENKAARKAKR